MLGAKPGSNHRGFPVVAGEVLPRASICWTYAGTVRTLVLPEARPFTIGRDAARDLVLDEPKVSRLHATLHPVEGIVLLADESSANGTFLNGLRLSRATHVCLRPGDLIEIGETRIRFGEPQDSADDDVQPMHIEVPLDELLQEGLDRLRIEGEVGAGRVEVLEAFAAVGPDEGVARYLARIAGRLRADRAAAFVRMKNRDRLVQIATHPSRDERARLLAEKAVPALTARAGILTRTHVPSTCFRPALFDRSHAVVPYATGERVLGVIAIERAGGTLARRDLALLAVLAERIGWARSLRSSTGPRDTRTAGLEGD